MKENRYSKEVEKVVSTINGSLAQDIVDAVREVTDKNINFIGYEGRIIASTDKERIGSFHQAGYEAIMNRQMIVVSGDEDFEGARKGVNYPIIINNQVMGVIGITGEPSEVTHFGFLAAKITEVFIKEQQLVGSYESRKKLVQHLMNTCIYEKVIDSEQIKEILQKLHMKELNEYYCTIIEIPRKNKDFVAIENKILHTLGQYNIELYIYNYPNRFVILVPKNLIKEFVELVESIDTPEAYRVNCGIGSRITIFQFKDSYELALVALKYAKQNQILMVESSKLDIELILEELPKQVKQKYMEKVIGQLSADEMLLLGKYYECNMSLKETSDSLYIHKNTVQYRLDKISEKTGLNPRDFRQSVKLYLALCLKTIE